MNMKTMLVRDVPAGDVAVECVPPCAHLLRVWSRHWGRGSGNVPSGKRAFQKDHSMSPHYSRVDLGVVCVYPGSDASAAKSKPGQVRQMPCTCKRLYAVCSTMVVTSSPQSIDQRTPCAHLYGYADCVRGSGNVPSGNKSPYRQGVLVLRERVSRQRPAPSVWDRRRPAVAARPA